MCIPSRYSDQELRPQGEGSPKSGRPVKVLYADKSQFRQWCSIPAATNLPGQTNLRGLPPLVQAEIRYGLFANTQREADTLVLAREFIIAMPFGCGMSKKVRHPYTDEVARALADEDNDANDRGNRDVWETIVITGRRGREVTDLRLECIGRYGGLPLLWHDQTKVGNYGEAIRSGTGTGSR